MKRNFIMAACQMKVSDNKEKNIEKACAMIQEAAAQGAELIALPEMFNCPYNSSLFPEYAEEAKNSKTLNAIANAALYHGVHVVAGSIPENDSGKIYNSSFIFDDTGNLIGRHRKLHLFDIDIRDKITFKESDTLTAGDEITIVDTKICKIGVAICYDIRFPELLKLMAIKGAELILVPGAFNMTTGPAHWEILTRTRALDNQVYFAAISPARDEEFSYIAYANTIISDPWGSIMERAGTGEEIVYAEIDMEKIKKIREELPLLKHRRRDLFDVISK